MTITSPSSEPVIKVRAVKVSVEPQIILTEKSGAKFKQRVAGQLIEKDVDLAKFFGNIAPQLYHNTDLMPPGVRLIKQGGQDLMMVIECPPAINHILWGQCEGDRGAEWRTLAQPYRIIVGHWHSYKTTTGWSFQGARHFYSPKPLGSSTELPLYAVNVPNTNLLGYNNTGVGWICLYHTEKASKSIATLAERLMARASGSEPYNTVNMANTDGPRFYCLNKKPEYTWVLEAWEEKSIKEGFEWTLDPDVWIPLKVHGRNDQQSHVPDGVPLTLEMVVNGSAPFYYHDSRTRECNNNMTNANLFEQCLISIH